MIKRKNLLLKILSYFYSRCLFCEHWRFIRNNDYIVAEKDENIIWPGPHGECKIIDDISQNQCAWVSSTCEKMRYEKDNSDCEGSLITMPNFGCKLFKRRKKK